MESLGYMAVYLVNGALPWQKSEKAAESDTVLHMKEDTPLKKLCYGLPIQFEYFLAEVRALAFDETPKYEDYLQYFTVLQMKFSGYSCLDWEEQS